jgi:hypothetical protein
MPQVYNFLGNAWAFLRTLLSLVLAIRAKVRCAGLLVLQTHFVVALFSDCNLFRLPVDYI